MPLDTGVKKRMTLLANKEGMSRSDFRGYWAGPHAKLALGMEGISKYVHNRVDKLLWCSDNAPAFTIDGIAELHFSSDEDMVRAQASDVGRRYIPADEPNFLKGWTLCIVETKGEECARNAVKVIVPFVRGEEGGEERIVRVLSHSLAGSGINFTLNITTSTTSREWLWSEPKPPEGFVILWFDSVAAAHAAFDKEGVVRSALEPELIGAAAYLIDELIIR
jgi:hypothetical protein